MSEYKAPYPQSEVFAGPLDLIKSNYCDHHVDQGSRNARCFKRLWNEMTFLAHQLNEARHPIAVAAVSAYCDDCGSTVVHGGELVHYTDCPKA